MPIIGTLPATLINGVTADAPTVQSMFDYIKAQVNANAAASGANSDITALLGLTTPIGRNFGGSSAYISTSASTGSANAQVVAALVPNSFTKTEGNRFYFEAGFTNTGATTFNLNSTGLTDVRKQTPSGVVALTGGEIVVGDIVSGYFDGTYYVLLDDKLAAYGPATNLASATTTDLGTISSRNIAITGTTTITGLGSSASTDRPLYFIRFTGALTFTHNGTSLILPGSANITTAAGDSAIMEYLGSGNWRCRAYQKIDGTALVVTSQLPSQTGNSGEYLSTDGSTASWKQLIGMDASISDGTSATCTVGAGAINCASVTLAAGTYTVTFTSALPDTNYRVHFTPTGSGGFTDMAWYNFSKSTTGFTFFVARASTGAASAFSAFDLTVFCRN